MTEKEKLQKQMDEVNEKIQNEAIDRIVALVNNLTEKANRKGYKMTLHERASITDMINKLQWTHDNC